MKRRCSRFVQSALKYFPLLISSQRQQNVRTFCQSTPIVTLQGGVLTDQLKRTGEIVANSQFQFDNPLQDGALATEGFSVCQNNTLAYPGSAIFYQCLSGNPNNPDDRSQLFNNLYTKPQGPTSGEADQCDQIYIDVIGCEPTEDQIAQYGLTPGGNSPAGTPSTPPTTSAAPATSTEVAATPATTQVPVAPYPTSNNGTTPSATASGSGSPSTGTTTPESFVPGSGAASLIIGGKLVALVAGVGAFALF